MNPRGCNEQRRFVVVLADTLPPAKLDDELGKCGADFAAEHASYSCSQGLPTFVSNVGAVLRWWREPYSVGRLNRQTRSKRKITNAITMQNNKYSTLFSGDNGTAVVKVSGGVTSPLSRVHGSRRLCWMHAGAHIALFPVNDLAVTYL